MLEMSACTEMKIDYAGAGKPIGSSKARTKADAASRCLPRAAQAMPHDRSKACPDDAQNQNRSIAGAALTDVTSCTDGKTGALLEDSDCNMHRQDQEEHPDVHGMIDGFEPRHASLVEVGTSLLCSMLLLFTTLTDLLYRCGCCYSSL